MMKQYLNLIFIIGSSFIFACTGTQSIDSGPKNDEKQITALNIKDITGIEWILTQMTKNNKPVALVKDSQTTFACNENGRVTGKATLNQYSGNLKLQDDGEIIWSKAFIMTRMAGPPELMQQETDFTQTLMKTTRMYLKESKLVLMSNDKSSLLEFEQKQ
jgi:heat shock protein HslJ